ncbi:hypothetical protein ACFL2H_11865 [Planctomycetota bacterium]
MSQQDDVDLIRRFVSSFERLDDLDYFDEPEPPAELRWEVEEDDGMCSGPGRRIEWRPAAIDTPADALSIFDDRVSARLPRLYKLLIQSYRWLEVHLESLCLFANPPGPDLQALFDQMYADPVLNYTLNPAGFVRFAMAASGCYDPVCFDLNQYHDGECPIVRFEHESILCFDKIGESEQIFSSFREMMESEIRIADASSE